MTTTDLKPIPYYLPAWQAGHIAWLAAEGYPISYAVPDGTEATRADLRGADLSGAVLTGADLTGADLYGANLTGADLTGAYLYGANINGTLTA